MINFNSIKVRLERFSLKAMMEKPEFQFHKGTIRTKIVNDFYRLRNISIP